MTQTSSQISGSGPANDRLFSGRAFVALLRATREVWAARWKPLSASVAGCFVLALVLRPFDPGWMKPVEAGGHASLVRLAQTLSHWGEFHLAPLMALGLVAAGGWVLKRREAMYAACAGFLGGATAGTLVMLTKIVFGRPRPDQHMVDGFYWFKMGSNWASFPSGHTAHCFGMAVGVSMVLPWTWPFTLLAATAVAWSRYQLDRHYPTDILMGMWLGVAAGVVFGLAARRCLKRHWPRIPDSSVSPQLPPV